MNSLKGIKLHQFFIRASTDGYGQCSYLRLVDTSNSVNCLLVMGKACVTPVKLFMIPRLKLAATLVSVRVSNMLRKELQYNDIEEN